MKELTNAAEKLQRDIWTTSSARFNAARRLTLYERLSVLSISGWAIVGLLISTMHSLLGLEPSAIEPSLYAFLGIAISLSVLVVGLLEAFGQYQIKASKFHDNARDLTQLQKKMAIAIADSSFTKKDIEKLRRKYEQLIRECPFNHGPVDRNYFLSLQRHAPEFVDAGGVPRMGFLAGIYHRLVYWLSSLWLFLLSWSIVVLLIRWTIKSAGAAVGTPT